MDISLTNKLSILPMPVSPGRAVRAYVPVQNFQTSSTTSTQDIVITPPRIQQGGTRLVNETEQNLSGGGYRRSRTFEREDGRSFTKVEEFAFTERGARRAVIQQNPSGSVTVYEEILDRQDSGNFRRTQRFQEANGEISTHITTDYQVMDPFILTGGNAPYAVYTSFEPVRGTQLDLRA